MMNNVMPYIILLVMVGMLVIGWKNIVDYNKKVEVEYKQHIEAAQAFMEKEVYIDAVSEYEAALRLVREDYEVAVQIVSLYKELNMENNYIAACENAIKADVTKPEPYLWIADSYIDSNDFGRAYDILQDAIANTESSDEISKRLIKIMGSYNIATCKVDEFKGWVYEDDSSTGYAAVAIDGAYGLLSTENTIKTECIYEDIGLLMSELIPVRNNGEYYYITEEGYRKLVPEHPVSYLGTFHDNYGAIKIGDQYGYIDRSAEEHHVEYEYAGSFYNNIAAVRKNGKWGVINNSFGEVTDFVFDDILMDEYGFCSVYGVFWAKRDGQYFLYNAQGDCISEGYDEVRLFASDQPAAVKKNGKWGFVSKEGEMVIEPTYEDADSFSLGYAPYCENGKWGCINENGVTLIQPEFDEIKPFSKNGYAPVIQEGVQRFMVITIYE